jgi:hypothetical protein
MREAVAALYAGRAAKESVMLPNFGGFLLSSHAWRGFRRSEDHQTVWEEREMNRITIVLVAAVALVLGACSPKIYGTVQLLDANLQLIPPAKESPQGTVVNMINTTTTLEKASQSVAVDAEGAFESLKEYLIPGTYKVEASRIGYMTETQSVEITKYGGKKVGFKLRKIPEGKRKSIEGTRSDEDKIVNPGEVNIQPPTM